VQGADLKRFISIVQLDGSIQELTSDDLPISIGASTDNAIIVPSGEALFAFIGESQGHLFIQPTSETTQMLFHNNRVVTESTWLKAKDIVQIGELQISYEVSGDKLFFSVSTLNSTKQALSPPQIPPPGQTNIGRLSPAIPVHVNNKPLFSKKKRISALVLASVFILLGCSLLFVLFARPLELTVQPEPDTISIKGFPPPIRFGPGFLCIPGTYNLEIRKDGYVPFAQMITISRSDKNVISATLEKLPGILKLVATPKELVSVYSDRLLIGTTPPDEMEISAGKHQLTISKPRYKSLSKEIDIVGEGKAQTLEITLQPDWAEVTFVSEPAGAAVTLQSEFLGETPLTLELLSGRHKLFFKKELYTDTVIDISVTAGEPQQHQVMLTPLPGSLTLSTTPSGAAVTVDKEYKGTTPTTVAISSRTDHEVTLTAPGYKSLTKSVTLEPAQKKELKLNLEQNQGVVYLTTNPPDASVSINGRVFKNGQGRLVLPATSQLLEIKAPGYKSETRNILPRVGFSQQITIDLTPLGSNNAAGIQTPQSSKLLTASGQKMIAVKPAPFTMGAPRREPGRRANEQQHTIIMKRLFYLSENVVTNREYRLFKGSHNSGSAYGQSLNSDSQPVVNITWEDAVKYLNWLSIQDNLQPFYIASKNTFVAASPPTNGYRLPTEAEWSFCAREAGNTQPQRFPWDGTFPPRTVSGNYADESARAILPRIINGYNDRFPVSSPAGAFPANRGGFYDMGGNVSEWCHDFYSASATALTNRADPLGPSTGTHRVIRGSSWRDASITELRLSYRAYHRTGRDNVGFRIARYQ